jgi:hypothetical protein
MGAIMSAAAAEGRKPLTLGATVDVEPTPKPVLPPDCPTVPLGINGQYLYCLDPMGQLHRLDTDRLGAKREILVCKVEWLYDNFPRLKKIAKRDGALEWLVVGWHPEHFYESLKTACDNLGLFLPEQRVRGRGAHRGEDGNVIFHLGNQLSMFGKLQKLGVRGRLVFPLAPPLPAPFHAPVIGPGGPAERLLHRIADSWQFGRPALDPVLLLGMLGVVVLAGALPVRPGCALTGERGTGKSELMKLLVRVLGDWLIYSTDATEAGIRQKLGMDAIGMLLDEQESHGDNSAFTRVQHYWRSSYSGGTTHRGGQNHTGSEFLAMSVLIAAAINLPAMDSADRSRCIVIEMKPLPPGPKVRLVHDAIWPTIGPLLIRRLQDHYKRLIGEIIPAWRALLMGAGWDDRGADTYGVTLGCAWAMLYDLAPTDDDLALHAADLAALLAAHKADEVPTYRRAFHRLWGWRVDLYRRGEQRSLGEYAIEAAGYGSDSSNDGGLQPFDAAAIDRSEPVAAHAAEQLDAKEAARALRKYGITIMRAKADSAWRGLGSWRAGERLLCIARVAPALGEVFRGTPWTGTESGSGGWGAAFLRAPGAVQLGYPLRYPWGCSRAVCMRLDLALAGMVGDADLAEIWDGTPAESVA